MRSLNLKWITAILTLLICLIGGMMLLNGLYLDDYFLYEARSTINTEFEEARDVCSQKNMKTCIDFLTRLSEDTRRRYMLVNNDYKVVFSTSPEFNSGEAFAISDAQMTFMEGNASQLQGGRILYRTGWSRNDTLTDLTLIGQLDGQHYLLISQPLQGIQESVAIANRFLLYLGLITLVLGSLITWFLSRRMVSPLLEITEITKQIAILDFSQRYEGHLKDEVGTLGRSINRISEKLHTTIVDLEASNKDLQNELKLQQRFLASVSHEFKTPVGLIRGYSESLQLGLAKDEAEAKEFTEIIIGETDQLTRLIEDLLFLTRMDSGLFTFNMSKFDLTQTIQTVSHRMTPLFQEKNLSLSLDLCPTPMVTADESRIIQVLSNLLSNAIRHSDVGTPIKIRSLVQNGMVRIDIHNQTQAIPDEHLPHLFDPFYRVTSGRSRDQGGTGLGLSIVKTIVEKHNGQCGVTNGDEGVWVWFKLPC